MQNFTPVHSFLIISIIAVMFLSCSENISLPDNVNECMRERLIEANESQDCPSILQWEFQGDIVYTIDVLCTFDASTEVLDSECGLIDRIGGWGPWEINGVSFNEAILIQQLWPE